MPPRTNARRRMEVVALTPVALNKPCLPLIISHRCYQFHLRVVYLRAFNQHQLLWNCGCGMIKTIAGIARGRRQHIACTVHMLHIVSQFFMEAYFYCFACRGLIGSSLWIHHHSNLAPREESRMKIYTLFSQQQLRSSLSQGKSCA